MSVSEPARHHLYEAARTGDWDDQAAEALMSLLPPVGWADVATKQDLRALEDSLRGELRGEIGNLRAEMHHEIGLVRSEIAHQTRTLLLSLVGFLIGGAGVAIGTAQLIS